MDKKAHQKYTAVIGLEVHAQLLTTSKMYASDTTEYGNMPNTNISVITLAHPGTLPKINKKAIEYAIKMGLACHASITEKNSFDRKNYFYPDLPKGYQITQDKTPICKGGYISIKDVEGNSKQINLTKIHLEEDAGKSIHIEGETDTLVDYNRAGIPLIEIVSEPDMRTADEAYAFLTEIRKLVRYLEICDGNMEEGSLRCDANVSVMLKDATTFGKKVEIKNMNSIRNVQRAINYEIDRQIELLEKGNVIASESRTFDAPSGTTSSMRSKETLNDYRYFPEPDLPPFFVSESWIESIKKSMPSLPNELYKKFTENFKLPEYDALVLTESKDIALYFETLCSQTDNYKAASNWVMGPIKSYLNERTLTIDQFPITTHTMAELINLVGSNKVSFSVASQRIFSELTQNPTLSPLHIAEKFNLIQDTSEDSISLLIEEVIKAFPEKVEAYRNGKKGLFGMFMGEIMKKSKGKADPKLTNQILKEKLEN